MNMLIYFILKGYKTRPWHIISKIHFRMNKGPVSQIQTHNIFYTHFKTTVGITKQKVGKHTDDLRIQTLNKLDCGALIDYLSDRYDYKHKN